MSFVYADLIRNLSNNITVPTFGSVIRTDYMRYDGRPAYYTRGWIAPSNQNVLFPLRLTAQNVPHPGTILIASWQLSLESDNNVIFKVLIDGSWRDNSMGTSGQSVAPSDEWYWKGLICSYHDGDNNSTLSNYQLLWIGRAGATGNINLDIAPQHAGDGGTTVFVNRTFGSGGQDGHEVGVCTGVVFQISGVEGQLDG